MSSETLLLTKEQQWELLSKCSFDFHTKERDLVYTQCDLESKMELVIVNERRRHPIWIVQWGRRRVLDPFIVILRRGLEPKLLSLSAALGLTLGVFPVCGVTVGLCTVAAVLLRSKCHWPTLMLANFVVTPFQLGLVVLFLRVGELVTGGHHFSLTSKSLWEVIRGRGSRGLLFGILHAVIGWSIFAPICVVFFFVIFFPIFRYLIRRFGRTPLLQPQPSVSGDVYIKQESSHLQTC